MSYEDLVAKRAEREVKEQDKAKGKTKCDRKRRSQEEAGGLEPNAKVVRLGEAQVEEDGIAAEPWRAPVAKMW